jgi:murein DD-endopeptidase MepM/ murein hydrolase activator NlpD
LERRALLIKFDSPDGSRPIQWTISGPLLCALGVAGFVVLISLGFLVTRVGELASRAHLADDLGRRNAELEESLLRIHALERELTGMQALDREIREWAGLGGGPAAGAVQTGGVTSLDGQRTARAEVPRTVSEAAAQNLLIAPARLGAEAAGPAPATIGQAHPLAWPVEGWVSSEYGETRGGDGPHAGIDLVAPSGAPVVSAEAGRVIAAGSDAEYGRVAVVDHGGGLVTLYGHNAEIAVTEGETVRRGQRIASVGSTGRSTAPHLHFEVRYDGYALDPRLFLGRGETERSRETEHAVVEDPRSR